MRTLLSFNDVILLPKHSTITSRSIPSVSTNIGFDLEIPILSAPMDCVTGYKMAAMLYCLGGSGVIHRFMPIEDQVAIAKKLGNFALGKTFFAVGASGDWQDRYKQLADNGVRNFCVDVANGHSILALQATEELAKLGYNVMAGNIGTGEGAVGLANAGAKSIRTGIGSGAACSTRLVTAFGCPTLQATLDAAEALDKANLDCHIISDGGIRGSADMVKCFAAGADAVMLGGLLAGTQESPGEIVKIDGKGYKKFRGMSSAEVNQEIGKKAVAEGASTLVPYLGPVKGVIDELIGGLKSGMSYANALKLSELTNVEMALLTNHGAFESTPHGKVL